MSGLYSIYKLKPDESVPSELYQDDFLSITKTAEELSIVCAKNSNIKSKSASHNWRCLKIIGILDFSLIGIIQHITSILKKSQISVFVISTYNTDYFLIQEHQFETAIYKLKSDEAIELK